MMVWRNHVSADQSIMDRLGGTVYSGSSTEYSESETEKKVISFKLGCMKTDYLNYSFVH